MSSRVRARKAWHLAVTVLLLGLLNQPIRAAAPVDVFDVDIAPLIDSSARYPTRFAVDIARPVSLSTQGQWSDKGANSVWTYTVRIGTAVSMSFHASRLSLPSSASLTVSGASAATLPG